MSTKKILVILTVVSNYERDVPDVIETVRAALETVHEVQIDTLREASVRDLL